MKGNTIQKRLLGDTEWERNNCVFQVKHVCAETRRHSTYMLCNATEESNNHFEIFSLVCSAGIIAMRPSDNPDEAMHVIQRLRPSEDFLLHGDRVNQFRSRIEKRVEAGMPQKNAVRIETILLLQLPVIGDFYNNTERDDMVERVRRTERKMGRVVSYTSVFSMKEIAMLRFGISQGEKAGKPLKLINKQFGARDSLFMRAETVANFVRDNQVTDSEVEASLLQDFKKEYGINIL